MNDDELLREYVERQSEAAFAGLVARHVNLVYGTARRVVDDSAAAQDVVQSVFIHLARKAWTVRDGRALPGWLYRAAYRTALDALRGEQRRRQRETEAVKLAEINSADEAAWEKLAPLLDEAMQHLNRAEQDAVVLRFFEGKTMRETGAALGTTAAAAQMRVNRALEKMRAHFARGGVTVAAGALALVLSARPSEAAPVGLAARVTGASLAGAGGVGTGLVLTRILFMSTKIKILSAVIVMALIITGLAIKLTHSQTPAMLPIFSSNSTSAKTATSLLGGNSWAVELPVLAAVPANGGTAAAMAVPVDPHADLKTAIPDMARILRAKGMPALMQAYWQPDELAKVGPEGMQQMQEAATTMAQNPQTQQMREEAARDLDALIGQTPTLNADGDVATYIGTDSRPMVFVKINGKWYWKQDLPN